MNENKLFAHLRKQKKGELLNLLQDSFDSLSTQERRNVFGHLEDEYICKTSVDGEAVLHDVQKFKAESLQGTYYAPFDINSKNCMVVPEETDLWFETLADLLTESMQLSTQGNHAIAVQCFGLLFECVSIMESGEEIVFADEYGMWMLPIYEEPCIEAYINSAASLLSPEEYAKIALPLIIRDSHASNKVYTMAKRAANQKQKIVLEEEIAQRKIRTGKT